MYSALEKAKFAQYQSEDVSGNVVLQKGTPCQSEECIQIVHHVSEQHVTHSLYLYNNCTLNSSQSADPNWDYVGIIVSGPKRDRLGLIN